MKKKGLVSVIIPIYNVEKYLDECLKSVINQIYDNIEIICIEDCGEDNSYNIAQKYEMIDDRIILVQNEKNRGLSFSRNRGIGIATGEYIFFLDSDDYIKFNCIERLVQEAEQNDVEGVFFDYEIINNRSNGAVLERNKRCKTNRVVCNGLELLSEFIKNDELIYGAQFQFWRLDYILKNGIRFYEGILHEDVLYSYMNFINAKRVMCLNESLYVYRNRDDSITTTGYTWRHFEGFFISYCEMIYYLAINNIKKNDALYQYIMNTLAAADVRFRNLNPEQIKENIVSEKIYIDLIYQSYRKNMYYFRKFVPSYIIEEIKNYDGILVYGAGKIARKIIIELLENNINILEVVETYPKEKGKLWGYTIKGISECSNYINYPILIATSNKYIDEIKSRLEQDGFRNIIIVN